MAMLCGCVYASDGGIGQIHYYLEREEEVLYTWEYWGRKGKGKIGALLLYRKCHITAQMKYWLSAHLWEFRRERGAWNKPWGEDDARGTARK